MSQDNLLIGQDFLVEQKNLHMFAWTGGDHNTIHYDQSVAHKMKLPDVIAHGMYVYSLAMAHFENYLQQESLDYELIDNQSKFNGMAIVGMKLSFFMQKRSSEGNEEKYIVSVEESGTEKKLCTINVKIKIIN